MGKSSIALFILLQTILSLTTPIYTSCTPKAKMPIEVDELYAISQVSPSETANSCKNAWIYMMPRPDILYVDTVKVRSPIEGYAKVEKNTVTITNGFYTIVLKGLKPSINLTKNVHRGQILGFLTPTNPILRALLYINGRCIPLYSVLSTSEKIKLYERGIDVNSLVGKGWKVLGITNDGWWGLVRGVDGYVGKILFTKGLYVTGRSNPSLDEIYWISFFRIAELGGENDPANASAIEWLHKTGTKVIAYTWMPAGYYLLEDKNSPFMEWVYKNRIWATLNPDGPFPHSETQGYTWMREYYFDLGNREVLSKRISYLGEFAKNNHYDGFFFDWASGVYIEEPEYASILSEWKRRHPRMEYATAVREFYIQLNKSGNWIIVTNQAFRRASLLLGLQDYDMSESYITGVEYYGTYCKINGTSIEVPDTQYYPVSLDELHGSINDTLYYINFLNQLAAKYAGPRFKGYIYMNYAAPRRKISKTCILEKPKNAIYYSLAMALIAGHHAYLEVPYNHSLERDPIYFYSLGKPQGKPKAIPGGYLRYYQYGIVLAGQWRNKTTLKIKTHTDTSHIYDPYTRRWLKVKNKTLTLEINPIRDQLTGNTAPTGRILLYEYTPPTKADDPFTLLREIINTLKKTFFFLPFIFLTTPVKI